MTNNKKTVKVKRKYRKNKSGLFSNFDSVMITVMLVSVLVVSLWGIYNSVNHEPNPEVNPTQTEAPSTLGSLCPTVFPEEVEKAAKKYGIEKERIYAIMKVESDFRPTVVSRVGARGLMQMMPSTYEELCIERGMDYNVEDLFDPAVSIDFGVYYFKWLYDVLGDWDLAHMAYNGGINNVQKWLKNPDYCPDGKNITYIPFEETRNYIEKINYYYNQYKN